MKPDIDILKLRMKGYILLKRIEQREMEERYNLLHRLNKTELRAIVKKRFTNKKGLYWFDTKTGHILGGIESDYEGLTNSVKGVRITKYEAYDVGRTITQKWAEYKDDGISQVIPIGSKYTLYVRINGFRDYTVVKKRKTHPVGGE